MSAARLLALLALLAACSPADTGMAGCWERGLDGRVRYLHDLPPMVSGWCPTPAEAVAMREVAPEPCGVACSLRRAIME